MNRDNGKFHVLHENISDENSYVILTDIQTIDRFSNESLPATENCKQSDLVSCSFLRGGGDLQRHSHVFKTIGVDNCSILFSNTILYKCVKIYKARIGFNIICLLNINIRLLVFFY